LELPDTYLLPRDIIIKHQCCASCMTKLADRQEALRALQKIGVTVGSERWPTPQDVMRGSREAQANILHRARSDLVKRYRQSP
jgi:hypothetical protein